MARARRTRKVSSAFEKNVFINCPFDNAYRALLRPLLFTIIRLGFTPQIATLTSNSGENRIDKIVQLMRKSRWSVHDISRLKTTTKNLYSRFNLPFELGIDRGAQLFGDLATRKKKCLILETRAFDYRRSLSDLSGVDIKHHKDDPKKLITAARDWFVETVKQKNVPSGTTLWHEFNIFVGQFDEEKAAEGFTKKDREYMPVPEYIEEIQKWVRRTYSK